MSAAYDWGLNTTLLRWDFVTDPPTQFLADLDAANRRLRRGQLPEAERAARRLLSHLDAKLPPGATAALMPSRLAEIRADGLALRSIAAQRMGSPDALQWLEDGKAAYRNILVGGRNLRPSSLALFGMVLALAGHTEEAVDPLVSGMDAGGDVSIEVVQTVASRLADDGRPESVLRVLRSLHERYPTRAEVAAQLAVACESARDLQGAAEAHVAAGALFAGDGTFQQSLMHFAAASAAVPGHPLAALGRCQALLALGSTDEALLALDIVQREAPHLAGAHAVMGLALATVGRLDDGLATVQHALEAFPDDPWLLDARIRLLLQQGDRDTSLASLEAALQIDPTDREWRFLRAELLLALQRDTDVALDILRELAQSSAPNAVYPTVRLARALDTVGRPDEALLAIEAALVEHPGHHTLLTERLRELNRLHRYSEAIAEAQAALHSGTELKSMSLPMAEALLALGRVDEAADAAERAVTLDPGSAEARRLRGLARSRAGRTDESIDDLTAAVDGGRGDGEVRMALADALANRGKDFAVAGEEEKASRDLRQALAIEPGSVLARQWMSELLRREQDYVGALEHANQGLSVDPDNAWLIGTRGQILEALDDYPSAEQDLLRALELDGDLGWARAELGELLRIQNRHLEALEHLTMAIDLRPGDPWPLASKGAAEYALNLYDQSLESLTRALELHDDYAWAHGVIGAVHSDIDDLANAARHIDRGLVLDGSMGWAWDLRGWLWLLDMHGSRIGVASAMAALDAYTRAVSLGADDKNALVGLGEALVFLGRGDEAANNFEAAAVLAEQDAGDPNALATLGWCRLRQGAHEGAVEAFVSTIALDPFNVSAAFDLSLTLLCAGREELALDEYGQALARARGVRHGGRRRHLLRIARRDIASLTLDQLKESEAMREVGRMLDEWEVDNGRYRAGSL